MFSIGFYPEYDSHHAVFRALCISSRFTRLMISEYRIFDYFFLHPYDLNTFRAPGSAQRKIAAKFENLRPYKRVSEPASIAIYMWQFQQAALVALGRRGMIETSALANDAVWFTGSVQLSGELREQVDIETEQKAEVLDFLEDARERFPLSSSGGLKDRSGLLDYRYDPKSDAAAA